MATPPSKAAKATLHHWTILLMACLIAVTARAQVSQPVPVVLFSDEPPGFFCVPPGGSETQILLSCSVCDQFLEDPKVEKTLITALDGGCQALNPVNAPICDEAVAYEVMELIETIKTMLTPDVIYNSGSPFHGQSAVLKLASCGQPFTLLAGPSYAGATYSGQPGTATSRLDVPDGTGGTFWSYAIVYSTTDAPLTTFVGCDGTSYAVRAILYSYSQEADLQVTKTDGVTKVAKGQPVTYTITATNAGPIALGVNEVQTVTVSGTSGIFTLSFKGQTTASLAYNATAADVQAALNGLATIGGVGGSVTVTLTSTVYTVTFGGALAYTNVPQMDGFASPGGAIVTTIVDGSGPATITDIIPAGLAGATYTATQTGGASGFTAAGSGSINDTNVSMPVGSTVTYSLSGTVGVASGSLVNTASVAVTGGVTDPNLGNNTATDTDLVVVPPTFSKKFGAPTVALGHSTSLTFLLGNPNSTVGLTGVAFTDTLPAGLVVATPNGLSNTCGGTATATAGSNLISLAAGSIAASGSCSIGVNVTGISAGVDVNSTSTVTSNEGGTGNAATASITVVAPPTLTKSFLNGTINFNGITTMTFVVTNPNSTVPLTGVGFTDTLPAGLVISTPNGFSGGCGGGAFTAVAGSNSITLSGGTVGPDGACHFAVNVTGTSVGSLVNTTSTVTSVEGGTGDPASATLIVLAPIPALGGWGLLGLTALLGAAALLALRRSGL